MLWKELGDLYGYCGRGGVVGDFNVFCFLDEKASGGRITRSMRMFNKFIIHSGLCDPSLVGGKLISANFRAAMRIDR